MNARIIPLIIIIMLHFLLFLMNRDTGMQFNGARQWGDFCEVRFLEEQESHYYEYDCEDRIYRPMDTDDVPTSLKAEFVKYSNQIEEKAIESIQKFKVKIKLVNGVTIEPNLYSNNLYEIASIIQTLSGEKLFAGQIKNINIELS